jgi:hypothetical protein
MERKLASVQRVLAIDPIPGADAIEAVRINGWQCVVKKGTFAVGDRGVYFEIDAIPPDTPTYSFLWTPKGAPPGSVPRPPKMRIRTIKLRGSLSQGLLLPLAEAGVHADTPDGTNVTELLGVGKYEPPLPAAEVRRAVLWQEVGPRRGVALGVLPPPSGPARGALDARSGPFGIRVGRAGGVAGVEPVRAPLQHAPEADEQRGFLPGGGLPLGFGGQALPAPAQVGRGLVPAHAGHRGVGLQVSARQLRRPRHARPARPLPPFGVPQVLARVPAGVHEHLVPRPCHRLDIHLERRESDGARRGQERPGGRRDEGHVGEPRTRVGTMGEDVRRERILHRPAGAEEQGQEGLEGGAAEGGAALWPDRRRHGGVDMARFYPPDGGAPNLPGANTAGHGAPSTSASATCRAVSGASRMPFR